MDRRSEAEPRETWRWPSHELEQAAAEQQTRLAEQLAAGEIDRAGFSVRYLAVHNQAAHVANRHRRAPIVARPRQLVRRTCGGRRRPGARRPARAHAPPGDSEGEPEPAPARLPFLAGSDRLAVASVARIGVIS
jgi:hypothetical protein